MGLYNLRDLIQFQTKLTNQITGMKNHRALNCFTVSNLKLNNVFSDMFRNSSSSIINQILYVSELYLKRNVKA